MPVNASGQACVWTENQTKQNKTKWCRLIETTGWRNSFHGIHNLSLFLWFYSYVHLEMVQFDIPLFLFLRLLPLPLPCGGGAGGAIDMQDIDDYLHYICP